MVSICVRVAVKGTRRGCVNVKAVILIGESKILNRDAKEPEKKKRPCAQTKRVKGALTFLLFPAAPRRSDCLQLQRRRSFTLLRPRGRTPGSAPGAQRVPADLGEAEARTTFDNGITVVSKFLY